MGTNTTRPSLWVRRGGRYGEAAALPQTLCGPGGWFALIPAERTALIACVSAAIIAFTFPFPVTKLVVGAGLAVLFTALSVRHFHIAIALFAFCLPLQPLLPVGSVFARGLNLQTLFVLGFCALSLIAGNNPSSARTVPPKNILTKPLGAFVLVVLLSAIYSGVTTAASFGDLFADVKNELIYSAFVFFTFRHVREDRQKQFVLLFILIVIVLTAARSLHSVLGGRFSLNPLGNRAVSMIVNQPNLWGGFLAMYSYFFFGTLLYWPMSRWARILVCLGTGVVLVNLVYTLSRGAWMAFAVSAVVIGAMKARRMLIPLVIIGGALYLFTPKAAIDRFQSGFEGEYNPALWVKRHVEAEEAASRIIQWRTFVPLMAHYGVTGAGFGQYSQAFEKAGFGKMNISPHSSVIQTGVEQGPIGLVFYFWVFAAIYRRATILFKEADSLVTRSLALGLLGCTVCLLLLDLTGTRSRSSSVMLFYWMLAGMTLNVPLKSERAEIQPSPVGRQDGAGVGGPATAARANPTFGRRE